MPAPIHCRTPFSPTWCLRVKPLLPFLLLAALSSAQAQDPALLGCWRLQHQIEHLADGRTVHGNGDCVLDFGPGEVRSRCTDQDGSLYNSVSSYRLTAPGRYELTPRDDSPARGPAQARLVDYEVDEDWLMLRPPPQARPDAAADPAPRLESLSMRVRPDAAEAGCEVRGPRATRVGRGRVSALRIEAPAGFVALARDPAEHSELAGLVRGHTLMGIFVPGESTEPPPAGQRHFLVAIEDGRSGVRPVKPADFPAVKARARAELNAGTLAPTSQRYLGISCDTAERICFDAAETSPGARGKQARPATGYVTALFLHLKGRVVVLYGVAEGADPARLQAAQRATHLLADQLRRLNP